MEEQENPTKVLKSLFVMVAICVLTLLLRNTAMFAGPHSEREGSTSEIPLTSYEQTSASL